MLTPLPGDMFKPGQVLNNTYEIEGILGRGGTGEVYRARNQISSRIVAIKVLNAEFSGNADYLELMKREEEMRDIRHDAVVRYSDNSRTADGHVFLVMDFVDGPSLNDWLQRGNASPRDLMIVCHRVADGLVATHARKIVHRDLSPDNIILRKGDPAQAVIIDFGIAKDDSAGARTIVGNEFAGKYEYAAPEQMEGKAEPRSDLYSLGATLLATYRGQIPNVGSTPGELIRRKGKTLDTEGVPAPFKALIDWLTQPDAALRPASAAEVVAHLDEVLRPTGRKSVLTKPVAAAKRGFSWSLIVVPLLVIGAATGVIYSGVWRGLVVEPVVEEVPQVVEPVLPAVVIEEPRVEQAAVVPVIPDLPVSAVQDLLGKIRNCGPLTVAGTGQAFAPLAPIVVSGQVVEADDGAKIKSALEVVADNRPVSVSVAALTPDICRILDLLPPVGDKQMSIWLGQGIEGQANFTGIFRVDEFPVVEVLLPTNLAGQHVWAVFIDGDIAYNVLPNVKSPDTSIANLAESRAGLLMIRLLHSNLENQPGRELFRYRITPEDIGKKLLVTFVTPKPLFPGARPQTESVEAMAEALEEVFAQQGFELTAVSTRLLDFQN